MDRIAYPVRQLVLIIEIGKYQGPVVLPMDGSAGGNGEKPYNGKYYLLRQPAEELGRFLADGLTMDEVYQSARNFEEKSLDFVNNAL